MYQRSESPSGGNFNDCEAVSEVRTTIRLGPTRKIIATTVSAVNVRRNDSASQSRVDLSLGIGSRDMRESIEQSQGNQHGEHEYDRDRCSERPVVGADRLL